MLFGAFLDPLVDRPENLFVVGGRIGEVHEGIVPRSIPSCQIGTVKYTEHVSSSSRRARRVRPAPRGTCQPIQAHR
jgi:hypothetical protein